MVYWIQNHIRSRFLVSALAQYPRLIISLLLVVVCTLATGTVYATTLTAKSFTGTGTVTVSDSAAYDVSLFSDAGATIPLTSVNFGGTITSGSAYQVTKTIYVKNTGRNGTNPAVLANITGLVLSSLSLPAGWTLVGALPSAILNLAAGAVTPYNITLSSNGLTLNANVTLSFTVNVSGTY